MTVVLKKWEKSFADRFAAGEAQRRYKIFKHKEIDLDYTHKWQAEGLMWYRVHKQNLCSVDIGEGGNFRFFEIIPEIWLEPAFNCLEFFNSL